MSYQVNPALAYPNPITVGIVKEAFKESNYALNSPGLSLVF